jgi:hypothetical protein
MEEHDPMDLVVEAAAVGTHRRLLDVTWDRALGSFKITLFVDQGYGCI